MQRLKFFLKTVKRRLTGYAVRVIAATILMLSEKQAVGFARFAGNTMYRIAKRNRQRIIENLIRVYGEAMTEKERRDTARQVCKNLAVTVIESVRLLKMSPDKVRDIADENGCEALIRPLLLSGKSVMIVTAHYGNWELLAARVAQIAPLTVLARKNDDPNIEKVITRVRHFHNVRVLDRSHPAALKEMIRMGCEGGHILGVLMDQDTKKVKNIFSEFMGIPALTPSGPANIAVRNLYVPLTGVLKPVANGRYAIVLNGPVPIPEKGSRDEKIQLLTDRFNSDLSALIMDNPQYWVWNHRRWRHSPDSSNKG
jgi:Kdo2-lipid IVA lauroyltransferase/acyltransferase